MSSDEGTLGLDRAGEGALLEGDPELQAWKAAWQAPEQESPGGTGTLPEALRRQVRRRSLALRWMTTGEAVFTLLAVVLLGSLARSLGTPLDFFTLTAFALLAAGAFGFSLWNRWGLWRPSAESTLAYLDLALLRCRRRRRGLRAGWVLLALEVALYVPWIAHRLALNAGHPGRGFSPLASYGLLAGAAGLTAAILAALGVRTRREQAALEELRRGMVEEG